MATKSTTKSSKTARASMPSKKAGAFEFATDAPRVIPTGGGTFAYVLNLDGKTVHCKVADPEFAAAMTQFTGTAAMRQTLPVVEAAATQFATAGWVAALAAIKGENLGDSESQGDTALAA